MGVPRVVATAHGQAGHREGRRRPPCGAIWFAVDGREIVFNTGAETVKGRALRRDGRVALCVDDERPPYSYVILEGTAELVDDAAELRRWAGIIGGRYMGEEKAEALAARNGVPGELLVRLRPRRLTAMTGLAD